MKIRKHIKNMFQPGYALSYSKKLIHSFDYFNIDYRFLNSYSFPPKSICLILTDKCNLKCKMCDIGRSNAHAPGEIVSSLVNSISRGDTNMSLQDWRSLAGELSRFTPAPLVLLTGTEPFLYPDVLALIDSILELHLRIHITTNGTLLSKHARKLVELCRSPYDIDISVSIDDIGDAHDIIRGVKGTFNKAVEGIKEIINIRRENKKVFPTINITCTISSYNFKNIESFVDWFIKEKINIDSITFNHLWFKDSNIVKLHNKLYGNIFPVTNENIGDININDIDMQLVQQQLSNIKNRCANAPFRIHVNPDLSFDETMFYYRDPCRFVFFDRCTAPWRNVAVTPKGDIIMSPLCFFPSPGNIRAESFHRLWNGPGMRVLRKQIKSKKVFPACSRCCMLFGSKPKYYKIKSWMQ